MKRHDASVSTDEFVRSCVDVPRLEKYCSECPGYGQSWMCPPFGFDVMVIWKWYSRIRLTGVQIFPDYDSVPAEKSTKDMITEALKYEKNKLANNIWACETATPGSMCFLAGVCGLCENCARKENLPCRNPENARYSIEGIGADVGIAARKYFNVELQWPVNGRYPEYYTVMMALLMQ